MRRLIMPLSALGLALAGCGPVNRGVESVNQPVVSRADYVLDLAESDRGLAPGESQRLGSWFDSLNVGYGDRVSVDDPSPSRATREQIAAVTARYGLLVADAAPLTQGRIAPSSVRVILSRSHAYVPSCPNWERKANPEFEASSMSNYGCAANTNLAAMVAAPQDLVQGQLAHGNDGLTAARAVKSYRDATPTGSGGTTVKSESTKGGK